MSQLNLKTTIAVFKTDKAVIIYKLLLQMVHILKSIVVYSKFMSFSYLEMSSNMNKLTS